VSILAVAVGLAISFAILAFNGHSPGDAAEALFDGAFGGKKQAAATVARSLPLVLVGLGWIVAFSARRINVGLEGQMIVGGITATCVALYLPGVPAPLHLLLAVVIGIAGGAIYAGIAAALWAWRGVNEIVSTPLMNFIALQLLSWVVHGPLKAPGVRSNRSATIPQSGQWPNLIDRSPLNVDVFMVVGLAVAVALMLRYTTFGMRLRLTGANVEAARASGIRTVSMGLVALMVSGGLAGLAGSGLVLGGETEVMAEGFASSFGLEGIVVALLALNSPYATVPAALLLASLHQGGGLMEARLGVPAELTLVTQGVVLLLVTGSAAIVRRARSVRVDTEESDSEPARITFGQTAPVAN
jgi:simple sugar transport system permease protein